MLFKDVILRRINYNDRKRGWGFVRIYDKFRSCSNSGRRWDIGLLCGQDLYVGRVHVDIYFVLLVLHYRVYSRNEG